MRPTITPTPIGISIWSWSWSCLAFALCLPAASLANPDALLAEDRAFFIEQRALHVDRVETINNDIEQLRTLRDLGGLHHLAANDRLNDSWSEWLSDKKDQVGNLNDVASIEALIEAKKGARRAANQELRELDQAIDAVNKRMTQLMNENKLPEQVRGEEARRLARESAKKAQGALKRGAQHSPSHRPKRPGRGGGC